MVTISVPAKLSCDAPGCTASQPVQLALLVTGGFLFKTSIKGWQVGTSANGAFMGKCPAHQSLIQSATEPQAGGH